MKKLAHETEIAEWYADQILNHWSNPFDEIEWLVSNLKEHAFQTVVENYYEYQLEVEENKRGKI